MTAAQLSPSDHSRVMMRRIPEQALF